MKKDDVWLRWIGKHYNVIRYVLAIAALLAIVVCNRLFNNNWIGFAVIAVYTVLIVYVGWTWRKYKKKYSGQ
ncbi:hypothetical protein QS257_19315 [Terrilactibacillus sp. S3-3]|nr:hypothetical protein QS257_19315 [Terrilactibacillus sp. S3-3]